MTSLFLPHPVLLIPVPVLYVLGMTSFPVGYDVIAGRHPRPTPAAQDMALVGLLQDVTSSRLSPSQTVTSLITYSPRPAAKDR